MSREVDLKEALWRVTRAGGVNEVSMKNTELLVVICQKAQRRISELEKLTSWQPIATAPKDGTKILAHMELNDDLGPLVIYWSHSGRWHLSHDNADIETEWGDNVQYWMPIQPHPDTHERPSA